MNRRHAAFLSEFVRFSACRLRAWRQIAYRRGVTKRLLIGAVALLALSGLSPNAAARGNVLAAAPSQTDPVTQVLGPGKPAPVIKGKTWIQGAPVEKFEKGRVYVVEFWATWCGPCIESIPHINELAQKYKDKVTVIGVSVFENGEDIDGQVRAFVKRMGQNMGYTVLTDTAENTMAETWMMAALQQGIPTAFIVDGQGQIAWVGHPMEMDQPLADVVSGTHDVAAARAAFEADIRQTIEATRVDRLISAAAQKYESGDREAAIAELDALGKGSTQARASVERTKLALFARSEPEKARALIAELAGAEELSLRFVVGQFSLTQALQEGGDRTIAVFAAQTLVEKMKEDDAILLYYAAPAYSVTGDHKRAAALLERAILAFDKKYKDDASMSSLRGNLVQALEQEKKKISGS